MFRHRLLNRMCEARKGFNQRVSPSFSFVHIPVIAANRADGRGDDLQEQVSDINFIS